MTQQDDITRRVLTDAEINTAIDWPAANTTMRAENDRAMAREVEAAVLRKLSKLRAPVANVPLTHRCANCGAVFQGAGCPSCRLAAPVASAPVADERAAFEAWALTEFTHPFMVPDPLIEDPDGSGDYVNRDVQMAWAGFQQACAALASAPVAGEAVAHAVLAYGRIQRVVVNEESAHEYAEQQRLNAEAAGWDAKAHVRPLVYGDAAPQASEAVRDALWTLTEHNALHFGEQHSTVIQGRAALSAQSAQKQGGSDA